MPEIDLDELNSDRRAIALVQSVQQHHALVKANRFLLRMVFALICVVFVLGLFLVPSHRSWEQVHSGSTVAAVQNPVLSAEIDALKGQMFGLVSGSIESKLRSLEDNIRRGSVEGSLNTIQDLKSDVKVLTAYNNDAQAKSQATSVNQQLIQEVTDLKDLVYLTVISCGLMVAALAGIWVRNKYRLTHQRSYRAFLAKDD